MGMAVGIITVTFHNRLGLEKPTTIRSMVRWVLFLAPLASQGDCAKLCLDDGVGLAWVGLGVFVVCFCFFSFAGQFLAAIHNC